MSGKILIQHNVSAGYVFFFICDKFLYKPAFSKGPVKACYKCVNWSECDEVKTREEMYSYCGNLLDSKYVYIINTLKKKNLLPNGFKMLCCNCKKGGR